MHTRTHLSPVFTAPRVDLTCRVERLASYIKEDFGENDNIVVLCVLKGGYKFCSDLVEFIKILGRNSNKYLETRVEFIRLKSYLVGDEDGKGNEQTR